MCGRYTLRKGLSAVAKSLGDYALDASPNELPDEGPRFNIAPTQSNLVLRASPSDSSRLQATQMRWGLVPSWSKSAATKSPMINARSETVAEKPSFRAAFQRRRCLIPADGFYEWASHGKQKIPIHFSMHDDSVFLMAGIWERWIGEEDHCIESYTVLTTQANALIADCHERMPVILEGEKLKTWLQPSFPNLPVEKRISLFRPFDSVRMASKPASPKLNSPEFDGPECLKADTKGANAGFSYSILLQNEIPLSDT